MPVKIEVMNAIREGLANLDVTPPVDWTKVVLTKLCDIGRSFGFQVGAKVDKANRDWGEWLYDVTWLEYNDAGRVVSAPLVAECEWGNLERITEDFDKLLLARASVRLMICEGNRKRGSNRSKKITEELGRRIRGFTAVRDKDSWLLAIYEDNRDDVHKQCDKKDWWFRYFTIGMNGSISSFP